MSFGRKTCRVDLPEICVTSGHIDSGTGWNAAGADGDTTNGGVGTASFVPKTNSSIALPNGLRFSVLVSTLPRFPQKVGSTLSQNMRLVGRLNSTP